MAAFSSSSAVASVDRDVGFFTDIVRRNTPNPTSASQSVIVITDLQRDDPYYQAWESMMAARFPKVNLLMEEDIKKNTMRDYGAVSNWLGISGLRALATMTYLFPVVVVRRNMRNKDLFEAELDLLPRTGLDMNRIMFVSLERPDYAKMFNPTEVPYPQDDTSIVIRTVSVPIIYFTVDLRRVSVRWYDSDLNEWNVILFSGWLKIMYGHATEPVMPMPGYFKNQTKYRADTIKATDEYMKERNEVKAFRAQRERDIVARKEEARRRWDAAHPPVPPASMVDEASDSDGSSSSGSGSDSEDEFKTLRDGYAELDDASFTKAASSSRKRGSPQDGRDASSSSSRQRIEFKI